MAITILASARLYGVFTFVTLGVVGAAIYSVPALIDRHLPFFMLANGQHAMVGTPREVDLVVLLAWLGLLAGVLLGRLFGARERRPVPRAESERHFMALALASAVLAGLGLFYLQFSGQSVFFFLAARSDQYTDALTVLWKWTAPIGLIASSLARSRKLLIFHILILFVIFLRGDRTMIVISAGALMAAAAYRDPRWYAVFTPMRAIGALLAGIVILFGKSIYVTLKAGFSGGGWDTVSLPLWAQFLFHFEPLVTFSHLGYVMRHNVQISSAEFAESILANFLIVPSWFGLSSNIYNERISVALPPAIDFGVAGNYLAHGWTVGGTAGAVAFYLILPLALHLCDVQFRRRTGALKLFWCCVGGLLAFYIHRNGMDNILSFVRQIAIVTLVVAILAAVVRPLFSRAPLPVPVPVPTPERGNAIATTRAGMIAGMSSADGR